MNLLFLSEISPFPPSGGEKIRSYGLLKLMSELNLTVHAIIGNMPDSDSERDFFKRIHFHSFDFKKDRAFHRRSHYYHLFSRDKDLVKLIMKVIQEETIDIAFIDYLFYGQYIGIFRKFDIPVIYGTHNAQAVLINQRPAVNFKDRIVKFIDFVINRFHEFYYFRKANALIVVSESDRNYHKQFIKEDKITVIPNFLIESIYQDNGAEKENYILMTANFQAFQNTFGLEWFLREVWDKDIWEKTKLLLVGLESDKVYQELLKTFPMTNIHSIGTVDDLKPYISAARVSIVPLLHGSGSRLKCLEAMALKTQLVSTSKGSEGIDHKNSIIIADSPHEFKSALLDTIELKADYTAIAYQAFIEKYSLEANKKIFELLIQRLAGPNKA